MTDEIKLSQGTLSDDDIDVLSGMMVVFLHAAEKMMRVIELHYEMEYKAGDEYKRYCKIYGKQRTDEVVATRIRKLMRGDERNQLGRLLKLAQDFHRVMEPLTLNAMSCHKEGTTDIKMFDGIQHDTNFLCYLYALMGNCNGADDEIKIISTLKLLAKKGRVSDNLLDKLKIQ